MVFKGICTALVTPFNKDFSINYKQLEALIERQIAAGVHAISPCGTTGESPTLSHQEHKDIIKFVVEVVNKRIPIIAGTGSNSTMEAVEMTKYAFANKCDAALIITPYYNKPTQEGLYIHYRYIAQNCSIPIIIYNVPGRTAVNISDATVARLRKECSNIVGIKDATGDLTRPVNLKNMVDSEFALYSGEDATMLSFNVSGGVGCISVASNVVPEICAKLQKLTLDGKYDEARKIQLEYLPLFDAMFYETNPIPVKYALSKLGLIDNIVRMPLTPCSEKVRGDVDKVLALV